MKTNIIKFTAFLLPWTVSFFAFSCGEPDKTGGETVKLQDTKWKLAGIVDVQTGSMKILEPKDCEECYTLTFDTDTTAHGKSMINEVLLSSLNPITIDCVTEVYECPNGDVCGLYCDTLRSVESYTCSEKRLKLLFNNRGSYLLYKLVEP